MLARLLLLLCALPAAPAAATGPAKLPGIDGQVGRVAAGDSADRIAVGGDPLRDVRLLGHVDGMVRGKQAP